MPIVQDTQKGAAILECDHCGKQMFLCGLKFPVANWNKFTHCGKFENLVQGWRVSDADRKSEVCCSTCYKEIYDDSDKYNKD